MVAFDAGFIAERFALGAPRSGLEPGATGQTSAAGVQRLETELGRYAVKIVEGEPRPAAVAIENAAVRAGLPLPEPLASVAGKVAERVPSGQWVRIHRWVDGVAQDWGEQDPELAFEVGGMLARIHALAVPAEVMIDDSSTLPDESRWKAIARSANERGLSWSDALSSALGALLERTRWLSGLQQDGPRVPSHRDLHPPNVIKTPRGPSLLVDWDSAGSVDAAADVTMFALVWAARPEAEPSLEHARAFISGYRQHGGVFEPRGVRDFAQQQGALLWWVAFNLERELGGRPGPDPTLAAALLAGVSSFEPERISAAQTFIARASSS